MKVTLVFLGLIAVGLAAKACHDGNDCTCQDPMDVANCENHVCTCVSTHGKRATLCHDARDCDCKDPMDVANCEGHVCTCVSTHGKRATLCHDARDCDCKDPMDVANCEGHVCTCVSTHGKRAEHLCMVDADCVSYDCHGLGNSTCVHHGSAEHGHNLCACIH